MTPAPSFSYAPDFSLPSLGGQVRLSDFNHKNRIALLFPRDAQEGRAAMSQYQRDTSGWEERDLLLLLVVPPDSALLTISTEATGIRIVCDDKAEVARLFGAMRHQTLFFLLGKSDFPVALRTNALPTDDELFARIDAMPMRQQEVQSGDN